MYQMSCSSAAYAACMRADTCQWLNRNLGRPLAVGRSRASGEGGRSWPPQVSGRLVQRVQHVRFGGSGRVRSRGAGRVVRDGQGATGPRNCVPHSEALSSSEGEGVHRSSDRPRINCRTLNAPCPQALTLTRPSHAHKARAPPDSPDPSVLWVFLGRLGTAGHAAQRLTPCLTPCSEKLGRCVPARVGA